MWAETPEEEYTAVVAIRGRGGGYYLEWAEGQGRRRNAQW